MKNKKSINVGDTVFYKTTTRADLKISGKATVVKVEYEDGETICLVKPEDEKLSFLWLSLEEVK